jgi:hypothetical protein
MAKRFGLIDAVKPEISKLTEVGLSNLEGSGPGASGSFENL